MTLTAYRQVDGDEQCGALGGLRARDHRLAELAIAKDVELKPEGLLDGCSDVFDRADRHGGERVDAAGGLRCLRRQDLAVAVDEPGQPRWCDGKRHCKLLAEQFG